MEQKREPQDLNKSDKHKSYELSSEQSKLLDNIESQIWYITKPDTCGLVNKARADFFGLRKSDLEGKSLYHFMEKDEADKAIKMNKKVFLDKKRTFSEEKVRNKYGESRLLSIVKMPKLDGEGNIEYLICLGQDLTNQDKSGTPLEIVKDNAKTLIDATNDEILLIDLDGFIVDINESAARNARKRKDEVIGNSIFNFMPSALANYIDIQKDEAIHTAKSILFDIEVSGTYLEITIHPIFNEKGFIKQLAVYSHDITMRKLAEKLLTESNEKFKDMTNSAIFYKDLFMHDIFNIFNVINMSIELYLNNENNFEDSLELIQNAIIRGTKLISNVRKISQIKKNETSLIPIEISNILNDVIYFIQSSFPMKKIKFNFNTPSREVYAKCNSLIFDVFENILNNAVKYNTEESVEIGIVFSKETKDAKKYIRMEFHDNGFGISDEIKRKIFQKIENCDFSSKGMGIGLSLVKKIIDSYEGFIWVEDRVKDDHKKGSKFIILVPEP